jgi:hypothetical protein
VAPEAFLSFGYILKLSFEKGQVYRIFRTFPQPWDCFSSIICKQNFKSTVWCGNDLVTISLCVCVCVFKIFFLSCNSQVQCLKREGWAFCLLFHPTDHLQTQGIPNQPADRETGNEKLALQKIIISLRSFQRWLWWSWWNQSWAKWEGTWTTKYRATSTWHTPLYLLRRGTNGRRFICNGKAIKAPFQTRTTGTRPPGLKLMRTMCLFAGLWVSRAQTGIFLRNDSAHTAFKHVGDEMGARIIQSSSLISFSVWGVRTRVFPFMCTVPACI